MKASTTAINLSRGRKSTIVPLEGSLIKTKNQSEQEESVRVDCVEQKPTRTRKPLVDWEAMKHGIGGAAPRPEHYEENLGLLLRCIGHILDKLGFPTVRLEVVLSLWCHLRL